MSININIKKLPHASDLEMPAYATAASAGIDLMAAIKEDVIIAPFERKLIATGIAIALPNYYEAQIRPRSGLALKNGITVLNSPGTIDADYRGEIMVILINLGNEDVTIKRGMRIAQMVIAQVANVQIIEASNLEETERGSGGFGSTGTYTRVSELV